MIEMGWNCKVCRKEAQYIADFGTSLANKSGRYTIMRYGYCEQHKPDIITIEEYSKIMNNASQPINEGEDER